MPSERNIPFPLEHPQPDQPQAQAKTCSSCHLMLDTQVMPIFRHEDSLVCGSCREKLLSARDGVYAPDGHNVFIGSQVHLPQGVNLHPTRLGTEQHVDHDVDISSLPSSPSSSVFDSYSLSSSLQEESSTTRHFDDSCIAVYSHASPASASAYPSHSSPDPLVDITRLRVRTRGRYCLYPGSTFQGTQKSGKNSYDVNVTIVDVDFSSSLLCGYLRIRGLTDDWPELTTYFDAEIIGSRYGFLTKNWGATEHEDMIHWSRFPAFRHVRNELKKPNLTISERDRGAVFMRWKEKFLVPDHRVQDISGASFAGFYYVCVDFNPPQMASTRSRGPQLSSTADVHDFNSPSLSPSKSDPSKSESGRLPLEAPRFGTPTATMNGFYFHQTSEPYQHLSLSYVPERTSSTFEFR